MAELQTVQGTKGTSAIEIADIEKVLGISNGLKMVFAEEQKKQPYHINLMDILEPNENDHSRILSEFLKQSNDGTYEVLDNFIESFINYKTGLNLKSLKPSITCGVKMIDVLVLDKDYAVIIENKIYNAVDARSQIARYIHLINKEYGYQLNNIFVFYLTRDERKIISEQSWKLKDTDYTTDFSERFFAINYRSDILPWLIDCILPNIRYRDVFLKSAIEQYIDSLEGMYNIRKSDKIMNVEIAKKLNIMLELSENPEENLKKINKTIKQLTGTQDQLRELKLMNQKECFKMWLNKFRNAFPELKIIDHSDSLSYPKVGIPLVYMGNPFNVLIEFDNEDRVYYGIGRHYASNKIIPELKEVFKSLLEGYRVNGWWYGFKYMPVSEIDSAFIELVNKIQRDFKLD